MFSYAGSKAAQATFDGPRNAYSKAKIRFQSSFMLTTVQPRWWASVSATSRRPIGEMR